MKFIFLFMFAVIGSSAHGSIYMEPYLGGGLSYSRISADDNLSTPPQYFSRNLSFGWRAGYEFFNMRGGLDIFHNRHYTSSGFNMFSVVVQKPQTNKGFSQAGDSVSIQYSRITDNFNPTSIGLFGAIDLPFLFDFYGTFFYSFGKKGSLTHHGPGVKVGVSYLSLFFVQLNIELQFTHYSCPNTECLQSSFNMGSLLFLVSVPFSTNMFSWNSSGPASHDGDTIIEDDMTHSDTPITEEI